MFYHDGSYPDVTAEDVLLEEVRRSYAIVKWLETAIQSWQLSPEDPDSEWARLQQESESGESSAPLEAMSTSKSTGLPKLGTVVIFEKGGTVAPTEYAAWLDRYKAEREWAAKAAKMAIDAGVAERLVRLAEREVDTIVQVIQAYHREIGIPMTPDNVAALGRHLRAIGGRQAG